MLEAVTGRWPIAPLTKSWLWVRTNGAILLSADLGCAAAVAAGGLVAGLRWSSARAEATNLFIAVGALGVALLGVTLTAMAILVGLLDENYLLVLRRAHKGRGGLRYAFQPYQIVSVISTLAFGASVVALILNGVLPWHGKAIAIGMVAGLGTWATCGTVQLVRITAFHGLKKADLIDLKQQLAQDLSEARRPDGSAGA